MRYISLFATSATILQFLWVENRNLSRYKIEKSICNYYHIRIGWYICNIFGIFVDLQVSYCFYITIFTNKKAKIVKDILVKKALATSILEVCISTTNTFVLNIIIDEKNLFIAITSTLWLL